MRSDAEILSLMWNAHTRGELKYPKGPLSKAMILDHARTARKPTGERIVPLSLFESRVVPLDKRPMRFDVMPKVPLPAPMQKRAVMVVAIGAKAEAELVISRPLMQAYAERYAADYLEFTELPPMNHLCGYKYVLAQVAKSYEQTLLLDADVIVMPDAPDIFREVPVRKWGLVDDLQNLCVSSGTAWLTDEFNEQADSLGLPRIQTTRAWNSGLVVAPTDAFREYYPPPGDVPAVWCAEQHWHTYCLLRSGRVIDLDLCWQAGFPWINFPEAIKTAHFVHINGCHGPHEVRLSFMRHFAAGHRTISSKLRALFDGTFYSPWWILNGL